MLTPFTARGGTSGLPRSNMPFERTARQRRWRVPSRRAARPQLNGGVRGLHPSVRPRIETDGSS